MLTVTVKFLGLGGGGALNSEISIIPEGGGRGVFFFWRYSTVY